MKFHLVVAGLLTVGIAHADDIPVRADVTHATIYGGAAQVTRQATVRVPAGSHRLVVPVPRYMQNAGIVSAALADGTPLGPVRVDLSPDFEDGQFDTPAQAALRARIDGLEDSIADAETALTEIDSDLSVLAVQRRYLESYAANGGEGNAPEGIGVAITVLGQQMQSIARAILDRQAARDSLADEIADMRAELGDLEQELASLYPLGPDSIALVVPVELGEAADLAVNLGYLAGGFGWDMTYTARLSTLDDTLTLDRTARITSGVPDRWTNVDVTLSGEDWGQTLEMSGVWPSPARIEEHRDIPVVQDRLAGTASMAPLVEPAVVIAETASFEGLGMAFNADVPQPQTLASGEDTLVPFGDLSFDADVTIEANPRRDSTAYLVVRAENTTGQPLIPGNMDVYRDAAFLSDLYLDPVPPGGELVLPFGSVDSLQLFWRDLSRNQGDEGFFNRANVQRQVVEFGVTNVSDQPEDVRILYAVPYSEQDDLALDVTLSIPASEENVDGQRGVQAWDLTVAPGETRTIRMDAEMSWPEGYDLYWQP